MAYTLVESYLYACPKVGYARNRSRTACFNEGFLKQAILGSKRLAGKRVDNEKAAIFSDSKEQVIERNVQLPLVEHVCKQLLQRYVFLARFVC